VSIRISLSHPLFGAHKTQLKVRLVPAKTLISKIIRTFMTSFYFAFRKSFLSLFVILAGAGHCYPDTVTVPPVAAAPGTATKDSALLASPASVTFARTPGGALS